MEKPRDRVREERPRAMERRERRGRKIEERPTESRRGPGEEIRAGTTEGSDNPTRSALVNFASALGTALFTEEQ
ncbi:hypothetical protein Sjap_023848 [Stephania japonica]|uniref:Uncharacterized protein n=1 Tax=Stephania japonica TaxID=461633 RepID=A0AAP0ECC7_9MAGN